MPQENSQKSRSAQLGVRRAGVTRPVALRSPVGPGWPRTPRQAPRVVSQGGADVIDLTATSSDSEDVILVGTQGPTAADRARERARLRDRARRAAEDPQLKAPRAGQRREHRWMQTAGTPQQTRRPALFSWTDGSDDGEDTIALDSYPLQVPVQRMRTLQPAAGVPLASLAVPVHAPTPKPAAGPAHAPVPPLEAPQSPPIPAGRQCGICLDVKQEPACAPCGHTFCRACLVSAVQKFKQCPYCRTKTTVGKIIRVYV